MEVTVPSSFYTELDKFFAQKGCMDIDRATLNHIALFDKDNKITISLIFMSDWDASEYDDYNSIILERKGAVFIFPPYWLCVPKELAMTYFEHILKSFYSEYVSKWCSNVNIGSGDINNGNNCGCSCKPDCNPPTVNPYSVFI